MKTSTDKAIATDLAMSEDDHLFVPSDEYIEQEAQKFRDLGESEEFIEWWKNSAKKKKPTKGDRIAKLKG